MNLSSLCVSTTNTPITAVELGARLLRHAFEPRDMTADMADGPVASGLKKAAEHLYSWPACECEICSHMKIEGKLEGERRRGGSSVAALAPALSDLGCRCGPSVVGVWTSYAEGYIGEVYKH